MNIAILAGARPEVIKPAPVQTALPARTGRKPVLVSARRLAAIGSQPLETFGLSPGNGLAARRIADVISALRTGAPDRIETARAAV